MLITEHEKTSFVEPSTGYSVWWKIGAFLFALGGLSALTFSVLYVIRPVQASGPSSNRVLNYQIRLTDPNGIPVADGTRNVKISFYNDPTLSVPVTNLLHSDCGTPASPVGRKVVFSNGVGTVLIGDTGASGTTNCSNASAPNAIPASLWSTTALYLGITIDAEVSEMTPRKRIVSTGFALNADMLDDLDTSSVGGSVAFVPVTDSSGNLALTQNLTVDGSTLFVDSTSNRIGAGTTAPTSRVTAFNSATYGYSSEMLVNNSFTSSGSWTFGAGWTINTTSGRAEHAAGNATALTQNVSLIAGQRYFVMYRRKTDVAGTLTATIDTASNVVSPSASAFVSFSSFDFVATVTGSATLSIASNALWAGSIDEVTIRQQNTLDTELITTGDMSSGAAWTQGAGWSVTGGEAVHTAGNATSLSQTITLADDSSYLIVYGVRTDTAGLISLNISPPGSNLFSVGRIVKAMEGQYYLLYKSATRPAGSYTFSFVADAAWAGAIDNVSIRKISESSPAIEFNGEVGQPGFQFRTNNAYNLSPYGLVPNYFMGADAGNFAGPHDSINFENGYYNIGIGGSALSRNTIGYGNTAIGASTLGSNTTGYRNIAMGTFALSANRTGAYNVAMGHNSLASSLTGWYNTAIGTRTLVNLTESYYNTAIGYEAFNNVTTGGDNTALGFRAGYALLGTATTTGSYNTFVGSNSAPLSATISRAGAIGYNSRVGCDNCFALGGTGTDAVNVGIGTASPITQLHVPGKLPTAAAGSVATASQAYGVYVQGRYAYVVNETAGTLQVFDVSNPGTPVAIGSAATGTHPRSVYVQGRYAYVANATSGTLQIFDVSNPASPVSVGSISSASSPYFVHVQGRYAYVANNNSNTLRVFDVSNPASPVAVGVVTTGNVPYAVYVQGRYAYVVNENANTMQVIDVTNPALPLVVGSVATGTSPRSIAVQGRYAYVVNNAASTVQVIDVSNPAAPAVVGSVATGVQPRSIQVQGRYAFITNQSSNNFQVIDVSAPASPVTVGTVTTANAPLAIAVQGRYAYTVGGTSSLQVFEVGGSYIQQLEVGGIETGSLGLRGNISGVDAAFSGGISIGQSLNVTGDGSIGGRLEIGPGNLRMKAVPAPTGAPTVALAGLGAGNIDNGAHSYAVGFVTFDGETHLGPAASVTVSNNAVNGQVSVTNIPVSTNAAVTARKIYRTKAATSSLFYLLTTINDNTTTSYTDNAADSTLPANYAAVQSGNGEKNNTTGGSLLIDGTVFAVPGSSNLSFGRNALQNVSGGRNNTAFGQSALSSNTLGGANVAIGTQALNANQTAGFNTAVGYLSLLQNTTAASNTAIGANTMFMTTTGDTNTAVGDSALYATTTGSNNVGFGAAAGNFNTTGSYNTFLGRDADASINNLSRAVAIGANAVVSCSNCMVLGGTSVDSVSVGINTASPITQLHVPGKVPTAATGSVATSANPHFVYVQGRYAYVVHQTSSILQVFDVSNPASPVSVGSVATGTFPENIYVQGRYAYVVGNNSLQIFDVSNPASPSSVGSVATGSNPIGVYVQGRYAYVTNNNANTLQIFDVSNSAAPVSVGSVATGSSPRSVNVQGRYAYVVHFTANTLQIFDVSNPASPSSVGSIGVGVGPIPIHVQGRYAYIVSYTANTLTVVDISNPASPSSVGTVATGTNPHGVHVQGRYAYVTNRGSNTLQVFDVGGSYIQQLEAGGIETGTLVLRNNLYAVDAAFSGGVTVAQSLNVSGALTAGSSGHFLPTVDDTYDLGSLSKRWRDLYLGPTTLHVASTAGETGTARDYKISIQEAVGPDRGNLRFLEGTTEIFKITPTGNLTVAGTISSTGTTTSTMNGNLSTPFGGMGTYENFLLHSEAFNNAAWTKTGVTNPTADTIVAPDGATTAERLSGGSVATDGVKQTATNCCLNVTYGTRTWTASVWLKASTGTPTVTLKLDSSGTSDASTTAMAITTSWQRYSFTKTYTTGTGSAIFDIQVGTNTVDVWGAQIEYAAAVGVYARTEGTTVANVNLDTPSRGLVGNGSLLITGSQGETPTSGAGARMMWVPSKSAFRAGTSGSTNWDDTNIGTHSAAFGNDTRASGTYSFAGGNTSTATNTAAFAFGVANATGQYAIAMGLGATGSGAASVAIGGNVNASGGSAMAFGSDVNSAGTVSVGIGHYVNANVDHAVVIGHGVDNANRLVNNTVDSLSVGFNSTIPTLFVGAGSGIGTLGNVGIGDATPLAMLTVGSGDLFRVSSTGLVSAPSGSLSTPTYGFTADTDTGVYLFGTDRLGISVGGVLAGRVDIAPLATVNSQGNLVLGYGSGLVLNTDTGTSGGFNNTFLGGESGPLTTTGNQNTFVGSRSGHENITGSKNTFVGQGAGYYMTTDSNVTLGWHAGLNFAGGSGINTFLGTEAGEGVFGSSSGSQNVCVGGNSCEVLTTGLQNVGVGYLSLWTISTGAGNVAAGYQAGSGLTTGNGNVLIGREAGETLAAVSDSTFVGKLAGQFTTVGQNTFIGSAAGIVNTSGGSNTFLGYQTGYTATPANANTTGSNNTYVGHNAGAGTTTQLSNASCFGANCLVSLSNSLVLGGTGASAVNVGINTATPGERLEVVGNVISKGTAWTSRTTPTSPEEKNWQSVAYGNGLFVAVSFTGTGNRVMTSPDGINWTYRTSPTVPEEKGWSEVIYGNGLFVAVAQTGTGNRVMTSPDGINWTYRASTSDNSWQSVAYGNGTFVAVANSGVAAGQVMTSPDGITWTARTASANNQWFSVTYGNGLFVAVAATGTGDRVMTSPDGITWTTRTSAADNQWYGVTYGNGLFVAVAQTGTGNRVMTSPDGITWTSRTSATDNDWYSVTYGNGLFVAVATTGTGNRVMTSPDGITWTSRASAVDNGWGSVAYGNGTFTAVSYSGTGNRAMTSGKTELNALSANNIYQGDMNIFGSVGVGTAAPAYPLHVKALGSLVDGNGYFPLAVESTIDYPGIVFVGNSGAHAAMRVNNGSGLEILTFNNGTSTSRALWLEEDGSLQLGTGNLSSVPNTLYARSQNNTDFNTVIHNGGNDGPGLQIRSGSTGGAGNALSIQDKDLSISRFVVTNSGNVGIGDSTPLGMFTVGDNDRLQVNAFGDVISSFSTSYGLDGAATDPVGAGSGTSMTVTSAANYTIGSYIKLVNPTTNCQGSVTTCYAKLTNVAGNVLTFSPSLAWDDASSVTEWHVPEIGATNVASPPLENRFGRGYFIDGIVTGNGTTYFSDSGITASGSFAITPGTGSSVTISGNISQTPPNLTTNGQAGNTLNVTISGSAASSTYYGNKLSIANSQTTNADTVYGQHVTFTGTGSLANSLTGLYVDVTTANTSDTTYAAALLGGNVGIGTATPRSQLELKGQMPVFAGSVSLSGQTRLDVQGRYAYSVVYASPGKFHIVDLSNPASPSSISNLTIADFPRAVGVQGRYAYVTHWTSSTFEVIDIADPTNPKIVGTATGGSGNYGTVLPRGRYVYVTQPSGSFIRVFDVGVPSAPVLVNSISLASAPSRLDIVDNYMYVATDGGSDYIYVYDITSPESPVLIGQSVGTSASYAAIKVRDRYGYVLGNNTFKVFDLDNPAVPLEVASITVGASSGNEELDLQGNFAYVANWNTQKLYVVDISTPTSPTLLHTVDFAQSLAVRVQGRYAYLGTGSGVSAYTLGSAYLQQLEVGGIETDSISVNHDLVAMSGAFRNGLSVGNTLNVAGQMALGGRLYLHPVPAPAAPTATPQGATGSTTWSYKLTAVTSGGETEASAAGTTSSGNATLDGTNFNRVTWSSVSGAAYYRVYRTTAGGTPSSTGYVGTVVATATLQFDDTGIVANGEAAPTSNTTASISIGDPTPDAVFQVATTMAKDLFRVDDNGAGDTSPVLVDQNGNLGIGTATPSTKFYATASAATVASFDRTTDDGTIISLRQDGTEEGSISVSGTTISYNAFTGSHYAWTDETIEQGMLVTYTGENRRLHGDEDSEILYGITPTSVKNDPKVLGVYLAIKEPSEPADDENPHLVMAVGNGDLWVADEGQDIEPGDYLVSSDTAGHAMKDQETEEVSHIIARAAEAVDWSSVTETIDGKKHKKISITFVNFTRRSSSQTSQLTVEGDLDFKGYGIENVAFLRGVDGLWSIDQAGKMVIQDIDAAKVKTKKLTIRNDGEDKTAGVGVIPAGSLSLIVENPNIDARSLVGVTFEGNPGSVWWIGEKGNGKFTLNLTAPAAGEVKFTYWIVGIEGAEEETSTLPPVEEVGSSVEEIPAETVPGSPSEETTIEETAMESQE